MSNKTMQNNRKDYIVWTDGGCSGNPGPGGIGVVICDSKTGNTTTASQGYRLSTNNRMEVLAVIEALSRIPEGSSATVYSDSKYVVCTMNGEFKMKTNLDLWDKAVSLAKERHIDFVWLKGHDGNENNEICDELSKAARNNSILLEDSGYTMKGSDSTESLKLRPSDVPDFPYTPEHITNLIFSVNHANNGDVVPALKKMGPNNTVIDFWNMHTDDNIFHIFGTKMAEYAKQHTECSRQAADALRWFGRGLNIADCILKVKLDVQ